MGNAGFEGVVVKVGQRHEAQNHEGIRIQVQDILVRTPRGKAGTFTLCDRKEVPAGMRGRNVRISGYTVNNGKVYVGPKGAFLVLREGSTEKSDAKDGRKGGAERTGSMRSAAAARDRVAELCESLNRAVEDVKSLIAEMDVSNQEMLSLAKTLFIHRQNRKVNGSSGVEMTKRFMDYARELAKREKLADGDMVSLVNTLIIQSRFTRIE